MSLCFYVSCIFFFKQKTAYEMRISDWSSDVCSSDLWSSGSARQTYLSDIQVSNPDSPLARLPRSSRIDVEVKSVTPLDKDSAMVRFDTQRRDANGHAAPAQPWVAVLRRSEEHTSELQSLMRISYAVFCLKQKT